MSENEESQYVRLARETIEKYVREGRQKEIPADLPEKVKKKRGVFVSLKKNGQLRGCIGTIRPTKDNIAREIVANAISACSQDPRFNEVRPDELDQLDISVDILGEPEPVENKEELDPGKYGVIVRSGHQTGLLLPDLEGVDTVEQQIDIARRKAGITRGADLELFRFKVERYR